MSTESVIDEIGRAIATLKFPPSAMRLLAPMEGEAVYYSALNHFVLSGDRRWWWEAFRRTAAYAKPAGGDAWRRVARIAPDPCEIVWFIAEDDQLPHYPVFETTPEVASAVIGECYGFEYYLIAKSFDWLVCEDHHGGLHAIGEQVEERLLEGVA